MTETIRQILYISDARFGLSDQDIADILDTSRRNNPERGVTGVLIFSDGVFIQVLEGAPDAVGTLYETIADDRRHHDVALVADRTVAARSFSGWAMAYLAATAEEIGGWTGVPGALNRNETLALLSGNDDRVSEYLRAFADRLG